MVHSIYAKLRGRFIPDNLLSLNLLTVHRGGFNLLVEADFYPHSTLVLSLIKNEKNMTGMSLLIPDLFVSGVEPGITPNFAPGPEPGQICLQTNSQGTIVNYRAVEIRQDSPGRNDIAAPLPGYKIEILIRGLNSGDSFLATLTGQCRTVFQKKAKEIVTNQICIDNQMITGLERLVGLGQGLTPSGDDFIAGVLLGLYFFKTPVSIDKKQIEGKLSNTTYAGRTLLYLALRDSFPSYLNAFVRDFSKSTSEKEIIDAIIQASQHGATSGSDSLAGLFWYLINCID